MSERFPVGSAVRVANNGKGSQWREIPVGEFSGTVIATGSYQHHSWSIPEVCVESPSGERRVILVGDLEADPDAGRMTLEEALSEAHTEWQMDQPAVVRIAYTDGTTEECRNIPSGEIAAGIFTEVCGNDRVAKAELVRGDGTVTAQWPLPDLPRATPRQGTCGRHGSRSVVMALGLTEHPACARGVGHPGLHRDTSALSSRKKTNQWGDNECLPLDSGR